jgi:hypothetical protein
MLVEGMCLAVREAAGNSRPGYIRLALQGLKDSEGRFAPLETTTFSQLGDPDQDSRRTALNGKKLGDRMAEGKTQFLASVDALLPTEKDIKFVVLKPSLIPPGFSLP